MKNKILGCVFVVMAFTSVTNVAAQTSQKVQFDRSKDLLLLQYDSKPDPDDIHAIAAAGSILAHPDFQDVNYYAVSGAYGKQNGKFMHSPELFTLAFGQKNIKWTDRHTDNEGSVKRLKDKTKSIIQAGGRVWVAEAGQSDVTADWMAALLKDGVSADTIKRQVVVVQHSQWNENQTTDDDLAYVKVNSWYVQLDDGNAPYGTTEWGDRSDYSTPGYQNKVKTFLPSAKSSSIKQAKALWNKASDVVDRYYPNGFPEEWSSIHHGGVDFSDTSEVWFILNMSGLHTIEEFWQAFVVSQGKVLIDSKAGLASESSN
ncbi:hypothetical protein L0668_14890 [Paraglaciecola aquimarina]|uniref:Uncharacterized protein n=1 Tax=Paraglaciecola algarum TaxID=3050085 RepID=A0ABS9DC81_9ALTE|nr:hypothetical protein [Paraglaciecola sp. G1-23]MCF2949404.1 hypothetical protein [Paraglaciecola sp. G1-23]